jgi:hypothetical protein
MPFSNPLVGGGGALIRDAIQSPDYVPGVRGWAIKRDGSAEFNDATVRGVFVTGAAGGLTTYIEVTDSVTGSELRFFNPPGTDSAVMSAPLGGFTGTTPTVNLVSGVDQMGGAGGDGRGSLIVTPESTTIATTRESDGALIGGWISVTPDAGAIVTAFNSSGANDGGMLRTEASGFELTADVNNSGGNLDQIYGDNTGIGVHGRFISSSSGLPTVAGTGWSVTESRTRQWGPLCFLHLYLTRTGADIAAGNIADVTIATITDAIPMSQTSCAAQWSAGTAAVAVDSSGNVVLRWLSTILQTGDPLRINMAYWGNEAP